MTESPLPKPLPTPPNSALIGLDFTTFDHAGSTTIGRLFRSRSTATAFALTRAAGSGDILISLDFTAFVVDDTAPELFHARREVSVTGSVIELSCALATLADYAPGVRRAQIPLPVDVSTEIASVAGAIASQIEPSHDTADSVEVYMCRIRPVPLPDTRTLVGTYTSGEAERVAGALAYRLGGDITATPEQGCIRIDSPADLSEGDRAAIERYTRVTGLRANIAALDPAVDSNLAAQLGRELDAQNAAMLDRRSPPAHPHITWAELVRRYLDPASAPPRQHDQNQDMR